MNERESKAGILRWGLRLALAGYLLMLAWVLPPLVHNARRLCPVRPDGVSESGAVPSFARQTGMSCNMCHTVFPQLTPYGRRFKLNGYTLARQPDITDSLVSDSTTTARRTLSLNSTINPLSVEVTAAYDHLNRSVPVAGTSKTGQNDDLSIPSAVYIWAAGRVTDRLGTFLQVDYSKTGAITANGAGNGTAGSDNLSVGPSELLRYADHTDSRNLVWGVSTTNGGAAKGDLWSSPVHGFTLLAFGGPGGPGAALKAPAVGGNGGSAIGTYAMYDDQFYVAATATHQDNATKTFATPGDATQVGWNPELRVAWEKDWGKNSLMVGGQVSHFNATLANANNIVAGPNAWVNSRLDAAADWQYQYISDDNLLSFSGAVTTERNSINPNYLAAGTYTNSVDYLNQVQGSVMYFWRRMYGGVITWVNNDGTHDSKLLTGDGSPHNQYWAFSGDYLPWVNTRFFFQYNLYTVVANNQSAYYGKVTSTKAADNNYFTTGVMYAF
jgi:hypothetical protein